MSSLTRCLLDKVVARRAVEGLLRLAEGDDLSDEELWAVDLLQTAAARRLRLFVAPASDHVLECLRELPRYAFVIQAFRNRTEVAVPTRYFKRWSRRLRVFGFTPEDARILALASFGTCGSHDVLGIHWIATYDRPLMNLWRLKHTEIELRLDAMRRQLVTPYDQVALPHVQRPEFIKPE